MRRRLVIAIAGLVVLVGGVLAAFAVHRLQQAKDVQGSSTAEFTLTTTPQKPPPAAAKVPWPTYGFDATRTRSVDLALTPPFRTALWRCQRGAPPRSPAAPDRWGDSTWKPNR